ncbi:MAG: phosphoserine phosphatase RsbU/P [Actinomycetota bacterium]|nr:phosphoserine phosphatase RsbU/P [Actinomycetota bacterium]
MADDVVAEAQLAVTELVTNAVRHGDLAADDEVVLGVDVRVSDVRVVVSQPTQVKAALPAAQEPSQAVTHGLGLVIVDRLARRWGVEPDPPGRVWFELGLKR